MNNNLRAKIENVLENFMFWEIMKIINEIAVAAKF